MPRIGEAAPAFEAQTTQGPINFPGDFKGKWIILFSHPSDFTPVCTSEFVTFGSMADEFEAFNCELVGPVSYTHLDVYKRQRQEAGFPPGKRSIDRAIGRRQPVICLLYTSRCV